MEKKIAFPIKAFEALPDSLIASNYIDFLLFLAKLKPALRIKLPTEGTTRQVRTWCIQNDFALLSNEASFACIAHDFKTAKLLQETDEAYEPHEYEFGQLLGYPPCCCRIMSHVGEANIDDWEMSFLKKTTFKGEFKLIDITGYRKGYALISHIPCSSTCLDSLLIAQKALSIITHFKNRKYFDLWDYWPHSHN